MLDLNNRVQIIQFIDKAIDDSEKMGYRLSLDVSLVDSLRKTVCPMGAVMLTRKKNPFCNEWMRVFMRAYDGRVHKLTCHYPMAFNLGVTYRRMLQR